MSALSDYSDAIAALVAGAVAVATDPADAVRILTSLAQYSVPAGSSTAAQATAALCRQYALIQLCQTLSTMSFSSYDDAAAAMALVTGLLDAEILTCADLFWDAQARGLQVLRTQITAALTALGANLAPLVTRSFGASLPASVIAQTLYQDGARTDEIIARVNPIHPSFCPRSVRVLAR